MEKKNRKWYGVVWHGNKSRDSLVAAIISPQSVHVDSRKKVTKTCVIVGVEIGLVVKQVTATMETPILPDYRREIKLILLFHQTKVFDWISRERDRRDGVGIRAAASLVKVNKLGGIKAGERDEEKDA